MADRIGQQLGNYRLIRLLGKGGFAEVYLGEHVYLKTPGAIKLLQTKVVNQEDLKSFLKEAQTIAQLVHPHIVRVLEFGIDGEMPFLVMDYAPGGTLRQRHPRGTRLPLATVLLYVKQVAEALQCAHEEKFIHRDVKPENMLVGRRNMVLLSDFGIALIAPSSRYQSTQEIIGTVAYMSPEQIQGKPRPASDQYSLGIVVYEWLSGDRPFHGSFTELCTQHMFASPPPLREKLPTLSPAVEQVVLTALAKDYKQRFSSVQAFATALEQACQVPAAESDAELPPQIGTFLNKTSIPTKLVTPKQLPGVSPLPTPRPPYVSLPRGTVLCTYRGHSSAVWSVIWSSDGTCIASASSDQTVQLWDAAAGKDLLVYRGHSSDVWSVTRSPDSRFIASASNDSTIQVWDTATGNGFLIYRDHSDSALAAAWSPDGTRIASASKDKTVHVWDTAIGKNCSIYRGHSGWVRAVAWSPDGTRIASASDYKTVQVWDATTGENPLTYPGYAGWVNALAWSPDGTRIASAGFGNTVQIWDDTTGKTLLTYRDRGHSAPVQTLAWSPDGTYIVSGSDTTVRIWEAATGKDLLTYQGHSGWVQSVAWSPDGQRIASASSDYTVQVWKAK